MVDEISLNTSLFKILMGPVLDLKLLQTEFAGQFLTQERLCRTARYSKIFALLCLYLRRIHVTSKMK